MRLVTLSVLCFVLSFASCTNAQNQVNNPGAISLSDSLEQTPTPYTFDSLASGLSFSASGNYDAAKNSVKLLRANLKARYLSLTDSSAKNSFLDSVSLVFTDKLLNTIIPHWYGTPWDFNGTTAVPQEGEIACGYFVSTTLRDMGIGVNRYKLAQQGGLHEAKSIAMSNTNLIASISKNQLTAKLQQMAPGLYFVGLDYHVGFLYLNKGQRIFIHSNYIEDKVMAENADYSPAFSSGRYCFAKITGNRSLALCWLMEQEMKVVVP